MIHFLHYASLTRCQGCTDKDFQDRMRTAFHIALDKNFR